MAFCGAKTRSGHTCKNSAMANGRCRMHGGKSTGVKENQNAKKHGIYSKFITDDEWQTVEQSYLAKKGVKVPNPIPTAIVQAGVELAQGFIKGEILAGRDEGVVVSKSSKAGEVSVSKTYASGQDGQKMGSHQMIADLLLEPFIAKGGGLNVAVVRA